MKESPFLRAVTVVFAVGMLVYLVAHASAGLGCTTTDAPQKANAPLSNANTNANALPANGAAGGDNAKGTHEGAGNGKGAPATALPSTTETPAPTYLPATKAAAVFHPEPQMQQGGVKPPAKP